jgi:hypothetical protein
MEKRCARWKQYEIAIAAAVEARWPNCDVIFDQYVWGFRSGIRRQIDVVLVFHLEHTSQYEIFECKYFSRKVTVGLVDQFWGFLNDVNITRGSIVTSRGFSKAARHRAQFDRIGLRHAEFSSEQEVVEAFAPRLDFGDPWNSMYCVGL